jgi:hypothetical protein
VGRHDPVGRRVSKRQDVLSARSFSVRVVFDGLLTAMGHTTAGGQRKNGATTQTISPPCSNLYVAPLPASWDQLVPMSAPFGLGFWRKSQPERHAVDSLRLTLVGKKSGKTVTAHFVLPPGARDEIVAMYQLVDIKGAPSRASVTEP